MGYLYNNVYTSMHEVASLTPLVCNLDSICCLLYTLYSVLDVHVNEILLDGLDIDTDAKSW